MKKVDVKKQPRLSFWKTFHLTIIAIRYRLFRSFVTMLVITVAIAFLMNSVTESLIKRSLKPLSEKVVREGRLAVVWVSKLTSPGGIQDMLFQVGRVPCDDPSSVEWLGCAGWKQGTKEAKDFYDKVVMFIRYLNWFDKLSYPDRRQLVHQAVGVGILDYLQDNDAWARFTNNLKKMRHLRFVDKDLETFHKKLREWPAVKKKLEAMVAARKKLIGRLKTKLGEKPML
ncbi:MAG: hypothetical protein D6820_02265, partial [Lentisphaerae bacterium]